MVWSFVYIFKSYDRRTYQKECINWERLSDPSNAKDTGAVVAAWFLRMLLAINWLKPNSYLVIIASLVSGILAVIVASGIGIAIGNYATLSKVTEGDLTVSVKRNVKMNSVFFWQY